METTSVYKHSYSISKAIEVVTAACVLHNFCYLNNDLWKGAFFDYNQLEEEQYNPRLEMNLGVIKRDRIAADLM